MAFSQAEIALRRASVESLAPVGSAPDTVQTVPDGVGVGVGVGTGVDVGVAVGAGVDVGDGVGRALWVNVTTAAIQVPAAVPVAAMV